MKLVTVQEMINIEKEANATGLSYEMMMENAGRGLAEVVNREYSDLRNGGVLGLIGSGNNGGDTLVALGYLADWGWRTAGYLVKRRIEADPLVERYLKKGGKIFSGDDDRGFQQLSLLLNENEIVMDGLLGTGFKLPLREDLGKFLSEVKRRLAEIPDPPKIVAVDCPSGVDCTTGECAEEVIPADMTVTMAAVKVGCLKMPAFRHCGKIMLVGIGLDENMPKWESISRYVIEKEWVIENNPDRPDEGHKGTFGSVLILAGSSRYIGAALLSAKSAYLTGCGLVTLAVTDEVRKIIAAEIPEATWITLPDKEGYLAAEGGDVLRESLEKYDSVLVGPGFGLHSGTRDLIKEVANLCREKNVPMVVDADGLKLLSQIDDWATIIPHNTVLTPHPGEMSYLSGISINEIQKNRLETAEKFSEIWGHVLVLKGAFTVVSSPDKRTMINPVATSALAKAGSGDVLAGIIASFKAQGVSAFEAAVLGTWIHGRAGLIASEKVGSKRSVLASDVMNSIPDVFREIEE